jgi:diadenosine tetraphosphatase ApaH/serine/threonine PP2A family protein phosphatase
MLWTRRVLSEEETAWLRTLPTNRRLNRTTLLVHSVPWSLDKRLNDPADFADASMRLFDLDPALHIVFTGHTHISGFAHVAPNGTVTRGRGVKMNLEARPGTWFVNPGSVGLPRDETNGANYAIYDDVSRDVTFRCVAYDTEAINLVNHGCGLLTRMPSAPRVTVSTPVSGLVHNLVL